MKYAQCAAVSSTTVCARRQAIRSSRVGALARPSASAGPRRSSALSVSDTKRVEDHRRPPAGTGESDHGDVGVAGEPHEHDVGRYGVHARARPRARCRNPRGSVAVTTVAPARSSALRMMRFREYSGSKCPTCSTRRPPRAPVGIAERGYRLRTPYCTGGRSGTGGRHDGLAVGRELHALCAELFPICRSITGDGVRATLDILRRHVPLVVHEVPSGTPALDWMVPREWNIRDAYVADGTGRRLIDFRASNLHVVSTARPSTSGSRRASCGSTSTRCPTGPRACPIAPPTTTTRGASASRDDLVRLPDGDVDVRIDATLEDGSLTYGECLIPGTASGGAAVDARVPPSLANDNTTGMALLALLGRALQERTLRYSYRLLFIPGTIGSIVCSPATRTGSTRSSTGWCSPASVTPAPPADGRRAAARSSTVAAHVRTRPGPHTVVDFSPYGYDERQFCSPGFDLPVGRMGRTPHGEYPEYHTSADDLAFVRPEQLGDAFAASRRSSTCSRTMTPI